MLENELKPEFSLSISITPCVHHSSHEEAKELVLWLGQAMATPFHAPCVVALSNEARAAETQGGSAGVPSSLDHSLPEEGTFTHHV